MATTQHRTKKKKAAAARIDWAALADAAERGGKIPNTRSKGSIVLPAKTFRLTALLGVTEAADQIGISTTQIHKARKIGVVSRVTEIAAQAALNHLGDAARAQPAQSFTQAAVQDRVVHGNKVVFLISVDRAKEQMVREFARMLDAELVAH